MEIKKTIRCFAVAEFSDAKGTPCSIQESSGDGPAIWFGAKQIGLKEFVANRVPAWKEISKCDESDIRHHHVANNRILLTQEIVKELLPILQRFAETGNLE